MGSLIFNKNNEIDIIKNDYVIDPKLIRNSLSRVLNSKCFQNSPKIKQLLSFLSEASLAGQTNLKSHIVGIEVYGRPPCYDSQTDTIVRRNMVRLRKMLDAYYANEGKDENLRILLPKGSYLPKFVRATDLEFKKEEDEKRIFLVVEKFKLVDSDSSLEYISVGLTEELISKLHGYTDNFIALRMPNISNAKPLVHDTSQEVDLEYILSGTIQTNGNKIRISAKLVESKSGLINWCEIYSIPMPSLGLLNLLEEVAQQIAATVLDPHGMIYRSLKHKPPGTLGSYLALFRCHEYQEYFSPQAHLKAREALEAVTLVESDYADAWAALANVYLGEALFGFNQITTRARLLEKCLSASRKAVALDSRNTMANYIFAMALFYAKDKIQFLTMADHALKVAPSRLDNIAVIGMLLMLVGEWERGLGLVEKAMRLNPYHPNWPHLVLSLYHLYRSDYSKALKSVSRFAALDFFPFQVNLAVIHGYLGNKHEAHRHIERMFTIWPESRQDMREILDFWFPFENIADVFMQGLKKAGFS